jgi:hypothetical protein
MAGNSSADVNIGATFTEDGLKEFHLAIGEFYTVPEKEVIVVRKTGIPEDELPVVFYIASRAVCPTACGGIVRNSCTIYINEPTVPLKTGWATKTYFNNSIFFVSTKSPALI